MRLVPALLWAVFAAILIAGAGVTLLSCGVWPWGINACPVAAAPPPAASRQAELLAERDRLLQLANLSPQCRIPAPQEATLPETPEAPEPPETRQANLACQPPLTDEVLLLVDVSRSMKWDFGADMGVIERLNRIAAGFSGASVMQQALMAAEYDMLAAQLDAAPGTDRIDVAKAALIELGQATPPGTAFRLLSFAPCNAAPVLEGVFPSAQRSDFAAAIDRLQLKSDTALAQAIAALPNRTDGGRTPDRPVNIVILTDGEDSCGGDPCAAAASLKASLPHAQVAVVSVAQEARANACIAERSGGRFLYADQVGQLGALMRQATGQLSDEECAALTPAPGAGGEGGSSE